MGGNFSRLTSSEKTRSPRWHHHHAFGNTRTREPRHWATGEYTRREHRTASNRSETALGKQNPTRKEHFSTRASPLPRPDLIASAGTDSLTERNYRLLSRSCCDDNLLSPLSRSNTQPEHPSQNETAILSRTLLSFNSICMRGSLRKLYVLVS